MIGFYCPMEHRTITIVDSHVHTGLTKYVPVEILVAQMEASGIDKAILVQYGGQFDNTYEQKVCQRFPGKFAPWGMVDTSRPDAAVRFTKSVEAHGMVGYRVPATARAADDNPWAFWERIQELGVVVTLSGHRDQFAAKETADLIERHPGIKFRIEHLGQPRFDEDDPYPQFQKVLQLSKFSNAYIAYSGLYGAGRHGYPYDDLVLLLKMIYDAFGPQRILWGSDFPPVCMHETVKMNLELFKAGFGFLTEADKAWILGKTALEFTRFI